MLLFVWLCGFFHVSRRTRGNREAELHAHPWNYMTMEFHMKLRGISSWDQPRNNTTSFRNKLPALEEKIQAFRGHRGHTSSGNLSTSAAEDLAHKSQQKDARQQPQCRRRIRLGVRCGSCHSPRSFGGILPPSRQIGLPPCLGRSVGRISRSYDLRVVRGNFQQVSIELFGCRPFREGCLLIRDAVFLRGCGSNVGKYKS